MSVIVIYLDQDSSRLQVSNFWGTLQVFEIYHFEKRSEKLNKTEFIVVAVLEELLFGALHGCLELLSRGTEGVE